MERVPLEQFKAYFSSAIELSSVALGGTICSVSDEFFAEAFHLLQVEPAPSLKGQFGPKGALFSGWETRRHNSSFDWCIIKLGTTGSVFGFDVDTAHFSGNEAPQVSVEAIHISDGKVPTAEDPEWSEILPRVDLGPNSRHLFKIPATEAVNYVKLNMYPDGGIARFRVYGLVIPVIPKDEGVVFDLAHVLAGGRVVFTSDQHFGVGSNLILPGRGKDMGDGWETKRSREKGHKDWAVIKLGPFGYLSHAEIDTAHFKGNFPESCELHAINSPNLVPTPAEDDSWTLILPRVKLGSHRQHEFQLENVGVHPYTHIKVTIYPDGGIKRVRVYGRTSPSLLKEGEEGISVSDLSEVTDVLEVENTNTSLDPTPTPATENLDNPSPFSLKITMNDTNINQPLTVLPALRLTPEAFSPFGQVIQAYSDLNAVPSPRTTKITGANQGTALKFHKLAPIVSSYPPELSVKATGGLSVYRCKPIELSSRGEWAVKLLERHPFTNQAFIPMGAGCHEGVEVDEASPRARVVGGRYLVIVAKNGEDDKPDLNTLRAFVATAGQGIVYDTAVWHHPMAVLDGPIDFTCVETQIGDGNEADCEIVELEETQFPLVQVPGFVSK